MPKSYAGIGSRKTPPEIQAMMQDAATQLAGLGLTLRSGGAPGADTAFLRAAHEAGGKIENFLPWQGHNGYRSEFHRPHDMAYEIAAKYHPAWDKLSDGIRVIMARNSHQVLGPNLDDPSAFILCWTPGGKGQGGTGQAIRIAKGNEIPVFDMGALSPQEISAGISQILEAKEAA